VKRSILFIILLTLILPISGCWSRREIDDLSIVSAVAVDKAQEEGKIRLSVQILNPGALGKTAKEGGGGEDEGFRVVASTGETLYDAERMLLTHTPKSLYWSHNRALIIGEEIAREGILPILEPLDRIYSMRRRTWLLIADGQGLDALYIEHYIEKTSGEVISLLFQNAFRHSKGYFLSDVNEFLKTFSNHGGHPVVARVEIIKRIPEDSISQRPVPMELKLTGAAVFKSDKLIGWLDETETRGLLWIKGKAQRGATLVPCPIHNANDLVSIGTMRASSKIVPKVVDGELIIEIQIKAEGDLMAQNCSGVLTTPDMMAQLNKGYATAIEKDISMVLDKAQRVYGVDIFGFGEAVMRKYPGLWKELKDDWDEKFPEVKTEIALRADIRRVGLTLAPPSRKG
jgi:spore germination protein KC